MTPDEINALGNQIADLVAWHACHGWKGDELAKLERMALQRRDAIEENADATIAAARKTLETSKLP